jgi:hypothetical protein
VMSGMGGLAYSNWGVHNIQNIQVCIIMFQLYFFN